VLQPLKKLGRCVVGIIMQVKYEDGCTTIHTCSSAAVLIQSQIASRFFLNVYFRHKVTGVVIIG